MAIWVTFSLDRLATTTRMVVSLGWLRTMSLVHFMTSTERYLSTAPFGMSADVTVGLAAAVGVNVAVGLAVTNGVRVGVADGVRVVPPERIVGVFVGVLVGRKPTVGSGKRPAAAEVPLPAPIANAMDKVSAPAHILRLPIPARQNLVSRLEGTLRRPHDLPAARTSHPIPLQPFAGSCSSISGHLHPNPPPFCSG